MNKELTFNIYPSGIVAKFERMVLTRKQVKNATKLMR